MSAIGASTGDSPAAAPGHRARRPLLGDSRTGLASVSRQGRDGVAHVARLLYLALTELASAPPIALDLDPKSTDGVSASERLRFAARVLAAQGSRRCDWMLFNHVAIARVQRYIPQRLSRPYGVFVHGVEVWGSALQGVAADALRGAAVRIANSEFTARRLEREHPDVGPVVACPLALLPGEPEASDPDRALLARVRPESVLLVGRMNGAERYKGHDALIEAWPAVQAWLAGAQLVFAGTGDDEPRLREKARLAGLGDDVLFCGRVSDATLARLYEASAVFAMPSRGEGFGIVYLEAMRAGRPCIGSRGDGAGDVIVDGKTGALIALGDDGALAATIVEMLSNPDLARRLGDAGRRRYEAGFTFGHFRDRLGRILIESFGSPAGGAR